MGPWKQGDPVASCRDARDILPIACVRDKRLSATGVLLPDGTLELNTPGIIEECAEEDCVKLAMLGKGLDADGDGNMERLSGTFAGTLGTSLGQIPIIGDIDVFLQE